MKLQLHSHLLLIGLLASSCDSSPPPFRELTAQYSGEVEDLSDDLTGYSTLASAEWTFEASNIDKAQVEFDLESDTVKQFGNMTYLTAEAVINHRQATRPNSVELFKQGTDQQAISEFFRQNDNDDAQGLLDILIVIDNSGSMLEEQNNLSTKLLPLLSYVEQSDWQIGIVTTDLGDNCLRDLIVKGQVDFQNAFQDAIRAGTSGSGVEAGVAQAVRAIQPGCLSENSWLRPNSTLAVLMVSDEDNCSDGTKCAIASHNSADYLTDYLSTIRQVGINAKVFGLIWHDSQTQSQCTTAFRTGAIYSDLIASTGGSWGSICENDYSSTLQAMSLDLSLILKTQFALNYDPFIESVNITVDGQPLETGYTITGNVIEFSSAPDPGANIYVDYRFSTIEPQKSFTLKENAEESQIKVYLDGRISTDYTYDANTRKVTFAQPPQAREVKINYKKAGVLASSFMAESNLEKSIICPKVNGNLVAQGDFNYDANTGLVSFNQTPEDGASIEFELVKTIGPQLSYTVFAPEQALDSVVVFDADGKAMNYSLDGQNVIFSGDDFSADKAFTIQFDNIFNNQTTIDLGSPVYNESLQVEGTISGNCSAVYEEDSKIDFSECGFNPSENIKVSFDYVKDHNTKFFLDLDGTTLDSFNEIQKGDFAYVVTVNGEITSDYGIEDQAIVFVDLPIGAVITVKLYRGQDS